VTGGHAIGSATAAGSPATVSIDSGMLPVDQSVKERDLTRRAWERTNDQRDVMIAAMVGLFKWLNGGVYVLIVAAWGAGIWLPDYRIVDAKTLMTLIGATVVQAGIAFVAITRFLFPGTRGDETP
jgi:hypothetical protein